MIYYRFLAAGLRMRGLREGQILEILADANLHCTSSGENPESSLGKPEVYASRFATVSRSASPARFVSLLACVVIGVMLYEEFTAYVFGSDHMLLISTMTWTTGMATCVLIVALACDYRLPRGFRARVRVEA